MNINHLSTRILRQILFSILDTNYDDFYTEEKWRRWATWNKWQKYLPLMAVCSYWRDILEPAVYSFVFAQSDDGGNYTYKLYSNLRLFTSQHLCNSATIAYISFNHGGKIYGTANEAIQMFADHPFPFLSVRKLDAWAKNIYMDSKMPREHMVSVNNDRISLANRFIQQLPNVSSLHFGSDEAERLDNMTEYILGAYLPRVHRVKLVMPPIIPLTFNHWSPQITHLNIRLTSENSPNHFPLVNSKSLKSLWLEDIPEMFTFSPFSDAHQYSSISFNTLKQLKLKYNDMLPEQRSVIPFHFSMTFPKLQKLEIHNTSLRCDVVYAKSFPKLKYLHYTGSIKALCQLALAQYGSLVYIFINLESIDNEESDFYSATNTLVSKMDTRFKTKLTFFGFPAEVNIANLEWNRLNKLEIYPIITLYFDFVCQLLQKLSNLEHLSIQWLDVSEFDNSILLTLRDKLDNVQYVLNSQLNYLTIGNYDMDKTSAILYLIICCPAITKVELHKSVLDKVYDESLSFVNQYPHIADIKWSVENKF